MTFLQEVFMSLLRNLLMYKSDVTSVIGTIFVVFALLAGWRLLHNNTIASLQQLFERTRKRKIAKQYSDGAGVSL
jgi:hypothetical protein